MLLGWGGYTGSALLVMDRVTLDGAWRGYALGAAVAVEVIHRLMPHRGGARERAAVPMLSEAMVLRTEETRWLTRAVSARWGPGTVRSTAGARQDQSARDRDGGVGAGRWRSRQPGPTKPSRTGYAPRAPATAGRALFVAVAELASVVGWMTHDAGAHSMGQHYLLLGLQAAKQAGPDGTGIGGHLMNCLARQANHLGHPEDALDLVQAAQYGTRKLRSGRLRALLCSLEARSHAVLGHTDEMARANGAAEQALADDNTEITPGWAAWSISPNSASPPACANSLPPSTTRPEPGTPSP